MTPTKISASVLAVLPVLVSGDPPRPVRPALPGPHREYRTPRTPERAATFLWCPEGFISAQHHVEEHYGRSVTPSTTPLYLGVLAPNIPSNQKRWAPGPKAGGAKRRAGWAKDKVGQFLLKGGLGSIPQGLRELSRPLAKPRLLP